MALPGDAPRFFADAYTWLHILFFLGVEALCVNFSAGTALPLSTSVLLNALRTITRTALTFSPSTRMHGVLFGVFVPLWTMRNASAMMATLGHHVHHVVALRAKT